MKRILIVGGGIIGTMHAYFALKKGFEVVQCDKDMEAQSASVRNFGLIWVSGRESGPELDLAVRSRQLWEDIGSRISDIGFRPNGSLTIAANNEEWDIVNEASSMSDATIRGFRALTKEQVLKIEPNISGNFMGALQCKMDAAVEPNLLLSGIRKFLLENQNYKWLNNFEVVELNQDESGTTLISADGLQIKGDQVFVCTGAFHKGFLSPFLSNAPIRRVRLQMAATEPLKYRISHSLADGDSFRYYPAFKNLSLGNLPMQSEVAKSFAMQLLAIQRLDGSVTIGDTHEYEEPFRHELIEAPYEHLQSVLEKITGQERMKIGRRWDGIYSQITSNEIYFRDEIIPGVQVVTAGGGRGNTLAPAIAEASLL